MMHIYGNVESATATRSGFSYRTSKLRIADIALFAHTHVAPEVGFELDEYPKIREWLERVRSQPGHVGLRE